MISPRMDTDEHGFQILKFMISKCMGMRAMNLNSIRVYLCSSVANIFFLYSAASVISVAGFS